MMLKDITEAAKFLPYMAEYLEKEGYTNYSFIVSHDGFITIQMPMDEQIIFELKHEESNITDYITQRMLHEHQEKTQAVLRTKNGP